MTAAVDAVTYLLRPLLSILSVAGAVALFLAFLALCKSSVANANMVWCRVSRSLSQFNLPVQFGWPHITPACSSYLSFGSYLEKCKASQPFID